MGLRAVDSDSHRLLFQAEEIEVDVEVQRGPRGGDSSVMGQITGCASLGASVYLEADGRRRATTADGLGFFQFEGLPRGARAFLVLALESEIVVGPLQL